MLKTSSSPTIEISKKRGAKAGTLRQKRVAKEIIANLNLDNPKSAGEVLKSVGYGTGLQKQPKRVIESEGVQTELKALGFDIETAKNVVAEILQDETVEPQHRIKAASEVFKVTGAYAAEKHINVSLTLDKEERNKILGISSKVIEELAHGEVNG